MDWISGATESHPLIEFADKEVLIREGMERPALHVLIDGTVSVYRGAVRVNKTSVPGALFGEMSALLGIPSSATVMAEGPVRAVRIENGEAFIASDPRIALHAARLLAQRLFDATTYLADLKRQFENDSSHLGMVDRILGSLLNQQLDTTEPLAEPSRDPRV